MKIIGMAGGIGSGKSTVSRFMAELGAVIIDADKVGHEVFRKGSDAWREVVDAFGKEILLPNGEIDRGKLGEFVFADAAALERLNGIMHRRIAAAVKAQLDEYRKQGVGVVVIEAPLLVEAGWTSMVDEVWVTVAPQSVILERLQGRGGLTAPESLARIRSQLSPEERMQHAHVVIDTDCSLDEVKKRVEELWAKLSRRK